MLKPMKMAFPVVLTNVFSYFYRFLTLTHANNEWITQFPQKKFWNILLITRSNISRVLSIGLFFNNGFKKENSFKIRRYNSTADRVFTEEFARRNFWRKILKL